MEDTEFYKVLVDRYVAKKLTDDELEVFIALAQEGKLDDVLMSAMTEVIESPELVEINAKPKVYRLWPRIALVAAAVAAIVFGVWFFSAPRHSGEGRNDGIAQYANDVAPGKNTATLTLPNGKTITLSDAKTGVIVNANQMKYNDGTAVDKQLSPSGGDAAGRGGRETELLTASTPRGGTYQFTLPDGTQVWLNAASKISFPSQFSGQKRKILLNGEAYFEVAKNRAKPFIVETDGQEVTVLGTHFNINAYGDEGDTKTTLLEGSVKVSLSSLPASSLRGGTTRQPHNEEIVLTPNQQSTLTANKSLTVKQVDAETVIAWKNGEFSFQNEPLESIMKKVGRWYDVDVVYKDENLRKSIIWGKVSRFENISKVLSKLQLTGQAKFKVEGRTVYVFN